jgi:L-Ala-D/L-Glu epimerase
MKLADLKWYPYCIPFRSPFLTAHGALSHRSGAIIHIQTEDGSQGNGEIAPLPEFSGTSLDSILRALPTLARELHGRELVDILRFLELQDLPSPLVCGLETALLDALGHASGQSLATLLASEEPAGQTGQPPVVPRTSIPVNAVVSGAATEIAIERARAAISAGFTCLKLKVTEASPAALEHVAAIRAAIGPEPALRLDANEGWSFAQAVYMLTQCAAYNIQYVEQPLSARDIADMARLRRISPIPLAADEALTSLASARHILDAEAADVLILKPQLVGGLRACRQVIQEAERRQIACVITSTLETGIGVTAALHLAAASPEITLACGLTTLDLLEDDLLQERLIIDNGQLNIPPGVGLGVQINWLAVKERVESK